MRKRVLSLLLAVCVTLSLLPAPAFAAFGGLLANSPAENQALLEKLESLTGQDRETVQALLAQYGLLDENGNLATGKRVELDGTEYTLEDLEVLLSDPDTDLARVAEVDGVPIALGDLRTILAIERELQHLQETYFSDRTFEGEALENLNSLMNQLQTTGISVQSVGTLEKPVDYLSQKVMDVSNFRVLNLPERDDYIGATTNNTASAKFGFYIAPVGEAVSLDVSYDPGLLGDFVEKVEVSLGSSMATLTQDNPTASLHYEVHEDSNITSRLISELKVNVCTRLNGEGLPDYVYGDLTGAVTFTNPTGGLVFADGGSYHEQHTLLIVKHREVPDLSPVRELGTSSWENSLSFSGTYITGVTFAFGDIGVIEQVDALRKLLQDARGQEVTEANAVRYQLTGKFSQTNPTNAAMSMNRVQNMRYSYFYPLSLKDTMEGAWLDQWNEVTNYTVHADWSTDYVTTYFPVNGEMPFTLIGWSATEEQTIPEYFRVEEAFDMTGPDTLTAIVKDARLELVDDKTSPELQSVSAPAGTYGIGQRIPVTFTFDELVKMDEGTVITVNGNAYTAEELGLNTAGNRLMLWYPVQAVDNTELTVSFGGGVSSGVSDIFGNQVEISGVTIEGVTLQSTFMRDATTGMTASYSGETDQLTVAVTLTDVLAYKQLYTAYHTPASGEKQELPFRVLLTDNGTQILAALQIYAQQDGLGTVYATDPYTIPKGIGSAAYYRVMLQANEGTRDTPVWVDLNWRTDSVSSAYIVPVTSVFVPTDRPETGYYYVIDQSQPGTWPTMRAELYTGTEQGPTYTTGRWSSSDEAVATIDAETGKVTPKGAGYVKFTFTADNGTPEDPSDDVSGSSGTYQVVTGDMPALHFAGDVTVRQYALATLNWGSNLAEKNQEEFTYTIDLFEGCFETEDDLADKTPVETYTASKTDSSIQIPEGVLTKTGDNAYTVRISAPNPIPESGGATLTSLTWITVEPNPVTARLIRPDHTIFTRDTTYSLQIQWELEGLAPGQSGTLRVLRVTDDGTSEEFLERSVSQSTGTATLNFAVVDGLRDLYQVMLSVDNGQDEAPSTDSYAVYVYGSSSVKIVDSEGTPVTTTLRLDNTSDVMNIGGSESLTTEEILALREDLNLMDYVRIQDGPWNIFQDRFAWSSSGDNVSINYKQGGLYEDIQNFIFDSYLPETVMGLSSTENGAVQITATHTATGMSDTITVDVSTLRDKFYLFQVTPAAATTLRYTDGEGTSRTKYTNTDGVLALYEPRGIASDILLSSQVEADGKTTEYTGTILREDILSGERDAAKLQLYPLNSFRLRETAKVELTLVKPDGSPLANSDVIIRGGVYKNGAFCQDAGLGTSRDTIGAAGAKQTDTTFTTDKDGKLTIYFDATQFWSQQLGESGSVPFNPSDEITYSLEIKGIAGDTYYPLLHTVTGSVSPLLEMRTASSVVILEEVPEGEANKPFVAEQTVDYNLSTGQLVDVRKSTGYVGPNSTFPKATLSTSMLLWGVPIEEDDYRLELVDENGYVIPNLNFAYVNRPFASIPLVKTDLLLSEDTMSWFQQGTDIGMKTRLSKWSDETESWVMTQERTLPFRLIDLTNVPQVDESANVSAILATMSEATMLKNATDAFLDASDNAIVKTLAGSLLNLTGGVDSSKFKMLITPSEDPTVFNALIWAGYDGLELTDKDYSEAGLAVSSSVYSSTLELGLPGKSDVTKLADGSYLPTSVSRRHPVSVESRGADLGLQLEGYYEAEIRYDLKNEEWKVYTKGGGFTASVGVSYGFDVNTMAGPVPLTGSFNVGGAVQLSFQAASRYSQDDEGALTVANDYLTNLRLNAYVNAFGGIGYDYAIVALKIGLFGSLAVDSQNRFLTRASGGDLQGQALNLESEVGIKFVAKVLSFSYEAVLVSGKWDRTWLYHDWDTIGDYWNSATTGLSTLSLQSAAAGSGLAVASATATLQSRDYLEQYARTWGSEDRLSLMALDQPNGLSQLQANANPASYPEITDDGQVLVYISDVNSSSIYASRAHYSTLASGSYTKSREIAGPDGFAGYGDSDVDIAGSGSFAAAAWVRLSERIDKEAGDDITVAEQNTLMNGAEIVASLWNGNDWTSTRLTVNSAPDMAPAVAASDGRAVVFWRSVVSRLTGDPNASVDENFLNFTDRDCIMYSVYDGTGWSEAKMLYNGTNGSVKALEAAMLPDGTAMAVYTLDRSTVDTFGTGESGYEIGYSIVKTDGSFGTSMVATSDTNLDENPQVVAAGFGADDNRFVLAWHTVRDGLGDIRLLAVNAEGAMSTTFPAALSALTVSGDAVVGGDFRLATLSGAYAGVENLTLVWNEQLTDGTDTDGLVISAHSVLKAAKFLPDGSSYRLSTPQETAVLPANTLADHFAAYVSGAQQVKAVIQATRYDNENPVTVDTVTVPGEEAMLYTATADFPSCAVELEGILVDYEALALNAMAPIQFTVRNTGLADVTNLKAEVAGAVSDTVSSLAPGESVTLTAPYTVGGSVTNPGYTITADNGISKTGTVYLDYPDLGISRMTLLKEEAGRRTVAVTLYNAAAATLADKSRDVKLAFYTDGTMSEKAGVTCQGFTVQNNTITITGADNLRRIDNGTFTLVVTFDVGSYVQDTLGAQEIPDEGVYLYANVWAEGIIGAQTEAGAQRMPEAYEANNQSALLLTGAYGRSGHEQVTLRVDQAAEDGKTVAAVTLQNNSLQPFSGGQIAAALLNERGELLEAQTVEALSTDLEGETASTAEVKFNQTGDRVVAYFIPPYDDVVLFEGLPITVEDFKRDEDTGNFVHTYRYQTGDPIGLLVTAYGSHVSIDGTDYGTGGSKSYDLWELGVSNPDLTETITVTCGENTFVLTLESSDYGTIYSQEPVIISQPQSAVYRVGEEAQPLTVEATSPDGGTLTYQWYGPERGKMSPIPGATGASYTPLTLEAGETNYYCQVTNTLNGGVPGYAESQAAKITVVEETAQGYRITFDANGGQVNPASAMTDADGKLASLPTPTWAGHQFDGWFTQADGGEEKTAADTFTADTTLYAHWTATGPETAETPSITANPQDAGYTVGDTAAALTVAAQVSDGGSLSYQWYRSTTDSTTGGTAISGATGTSYTPSTAQAGTVYYYCVVTNTNDSATGSKTAAAASAAAGIVVTAAGTQGGGGGTGTPVYRITVEPTAHGSVTADRTTAGSGSTVTLTVTPDSGYRLDTLTVTAGSGQARTLTDKGGGIYTFTMPAGAVTVEAVFAAELPFTDVPSDAWYEDGVRYVYEHGLMTGTGAAAFEPDLDNSRAMIATILWRLEGSPKASGSTVFDDVDPDSWYGEAVQWAAGEGIVLGYGNRKFGPGDPITREQMATMLYRYAQYKQYDVSVGEDTNILSYADFDQVGQWAIPAMQWACGAGIINGTGDGSTLTPKGVATRAQTAVLLKRFCTEYVTW